MLPAVLLLHAVPLLPAANPEVGAAIVRQFGEAQLRNVLLVTAPPDDEEPEEWKVYSRDPYRAGELLCSIASKEDGRWKAEPDSAGKLLKRVPLRAIDFKRLQVDSKEARRIVMLAAAAAQVQYETISYQLAANETTGAPEWGLALQNDDGEEVGFCIISGETGLVTSQDWSPVAVVQPTRPMTDAEIEGAEAAKRVKQKARKAWNWTEDAGRKTGSFFKELFK